MFIGLRASLLPWRLCLRFSLVGLRLSRRLLHYGPMRWHLSSLLKTTTSSGLPRATTSSSTDWETATTASNTLSPTITASQVEPLYFDPDSITSTVTVSPTVTSTSWTVAPTFSNMASYSVSVFAARMSNLAVLKGSPVSLNTTANATTDTFTPFTDLWSDLSNSLQIRYPQGSIIPVTRLKVVPNSI